MSAPEKIADAGPHLELWWVSPLDVREQDLNARVMPQEMMDRLAANIRKESRLESVPFTVLRPGDDGKPPHFEAVSGHHRLRAARMAELDRIIVLADTRQLPPGSIAAKQLAHNSISGTDDDEVLSRILARIDSVDDLLEAYVQLDHDALTTDPATLDGVFLPIEYQSLVLAFLPTQMEDYEVIVSKLPSDSGTEVLALSHEAFGHFAATVDKLGKAANVRSAATLVAYLMRIARSHIEQLSEEKLAAEAAAAEEGAKNATTR